MSEIISLHMGQAGVQIANAVWELFCLEHGISLDGNQRWCSCVDNCACTDRIDSFFKGDDSSGSSKLRPLATLVDSEPTVIDEIRTGAYRSLFSSDQLITDKEDAANNFARGYWRVSSTLNDIVEEKLKMHVEQCDSLCGFQIFHALGGGTGSGCLSALLNSIHDDYRKKIFHSFSIFPSPQISTATVEPYNAILFTSSTLDQFNCTTIFENQAMYEISAKHLFVEQPTYTNINRLISQVVSSITASLRFEGPLRVNFRDFQTNLIPFPRIHFHVVSYAPLVPITCENQTKTYTINQITNACFKDANSMACCAACYGQLISSCLLYRGDISSADVYQAVNEIKNYPNVKFVEWNLTRFKIGINYQPMMTVPMCTGGDMQGSCRALCMLTNSTSILDAWNCICEKFDLMWNKRAFVHWYLSEGMEQDQFVEAHSKIIDLINDYSQI